MQPEVASSAANSTSHRGTPLMSMHSSLSAAFAKRLVNRVQVVSPRRKGDHYSTFNSLTLGRYAKTERVMLTRG
jgi:hypothetical protein